MHKRNLWPLAMVASLLLLAVVGAFAGWIAAGKPGAQPPPSSSSPSAHPDPNGKKACAMLANAKVYGSMGDHVLVGNVATAAKASTNKDIVVTATLLEQRLAIASAAMGKPDQREADRNLLANMEEMERQCERAGL